MLFRALLMLLIPNTTVNCAITYIIHDVLAIEVIIDGPQSPEVETPNILSGYIFTFCFNQMLGHFSLN